MAPENDSDDMTRSHIQLASNTMVAHYRIIEKIGAGGMGEVYLAEDTKLDRKVALKFLPLHLCQDADCRARFKREAQAAAKLNHPSIATIHEVSEFNGRPFFAMEHIEGQTLRDFSKDKEQPLGRTIELAIQVCEGLAKAHSAGIVHRDIKPSNILIDQDGRAKIVDFGLASVHGSEHLTKTGSTLGTVGYMSPEQARGEEVDARSDLFSFGVVLYELVAGRSPFKSESEVATIKNIVEADPEPLARYKNNVPSELQRIISKALAKDKELRYQHADDLAADLRPLAATSGRQVTAQPKRRHQLAWSLALLGLVGFLVVGTVLKPWRLVFTPTDGQAATSRIVIVPFQNRTGDATLDQLGKMVADWTTQSLAETGLAEVVPSDVSLGLDASKDIRTLFEESRATAIVTGSYYRIGDSIQFQAQVSDADEKLLQAIKPVYTATAKIMDGVELVRQRVLGALVFALDPSGAWTKMAHPPTYEAYDQYLQGMRVGWGDKQDWAGSIPFFVRSCTLDSTFLTPLLQLSWAYLNIGQYAQTDSVINILESRRSELTPYSQLTLDVVKAVSARDYEGALVPFRARDKLISGREGTETWGIFAIRANHPYEAIEAFRKVDPERAHRSFWTRFAQAYHLLNEHDRELEIVRVGRRRFPASFSLLISEVETLAALGRIDDINKLIEETLTLVNRPGVTPGGAMRVAADELRAHGHETEAMPFLERAIDWYRSRPPDEFKTLRAGYAWTLYAARQWAEEKIICQELAKESPDNEDWQGMLGLIAARQGDRETALRISDWLRDLKKPYLFGSNTYFRACIVAILGDKEQAVALLKESFRQGWAFGIELHRDFDFESLWDYPPFKEILKPKG